MLRYSRVRDSPFTLIFTETLHTAIERFEYAVASMEVRLGIRPLWLLLSELGVARNGAV